MKVYSRLCPNDPVFVSKPEALALNFPDGHAVKIESSYLPLYPYKLAVEIVTRWADMLAPEGTLWLSVPDLQWIARAYLNHQPVDILQLLYGTQENDATRYGAYDEGLLAEIMRRAALIDIQRVPGINNDLRYLHLVGRKPPAPVPAEGDFKIAAVISVPRLGFQDAFGVCFDALVPLGVPLRRFGGAFWEQGLQFAIQDTIRDLAPDAILTLDYDTIFTQRHVQALTMLLREHPEYDAVTALQASRHRDTPLMSMNLPCGVASASAIPGSVFVHPLTTIHKAHFGLTLIRASVFGKLKQPWFWSQPAPDGSWNEGKTDPDIHFWNSFESAGLKLGLAKDVKVGHMELMIKWPGNDFQAFYQSAREFQEKGPPTDALG